MVALAEGADVTCEELAAHCRKTLAGYKVPRGIRLVPEVARTPSGKGDYAWARGVAG